MRSEIVGREEGSKNPKSPEWITADALCSAAKALTIEIPPLRSAIHKILPPFTLITSTLVEGVVDRFGRGVEGLISVAFNCFLWKGIRGV